MVSYAYTQNNPVMCVDPSGYKGELIELYKSYYKRRYEDLTDSGVQFLEILELIVKEIAFPSFQDPLYSYVSMKTGKVIVKGGSVSVGYILGLSYTYQRVYSPNGKIVDQSVFGFGLGPTIGFSASYQVGLLFNITNSSQMTGKGWSAALDASFIHVDMDSYGYPNDLGYDLGMNIGISFGAGLFGTRTSTRERGIIYD